MASDYIPSPLSFVADNVRWYEATGGEVGGSLPDSDRPIIVLTTRGARTGALRKSPVMRVHHGGAWILVGSMGGQPKDPQWCWNLRAHPNDATIQDRTLVTTVATVELPDADRASWWEIAVATYPDYADYQCRTSRRIPLFVATPIAISDAPGAST